MADPTSDATFTVTRSESGTYAFSPSSQEVFRGGTVTLVASNADSITILALTVPDLEPYEPLGPLPYTAIPSPGKLYTLALDELDTGQLVVKDAVTNPGIIVPVAAVEFSSEKFTPDFIEMRPGGEIWIKWMGPGPSAKVQTLDASNQSILLFGGDNNLYTVSAEGSTFTVQSSLDDDDYQVINYAPSKEEIPVKATVRVRKR